MINNELKSLIEKYCMGKEPTDAQMDEIMDIALQENADLQEVAALIEELKNKVQAVVTYTLTLTAITNPMMAMLTAKSVLGWDSAQSRESFAKLPVAVKTTTSQDEASEFYEKLSRGGMVIEPNAVKGADGGVAGNVAPASLPPIPPTQVAEPDHYTEAEKKYLNDAEAGNIEAQYNLGDCFANGKLGLPQDYSEAVKWYKKAAEQGHAYAQFYLAQCYIKGNGVEKDINAARFWANKAASQAKSVADTSFDIVLKSKGSNMLKVVKLLKDLFGFDLGKAKALVDKTPSIIKKAATKAEAENIKKQFEAIGASVELKNS